MVSRRQRLPTGDISRQAHSLTTSYFILNYQPNHLRHNRFGVIVSLRAGKTSVRRHLLKRITLEAARHWPASATSHDFLFVFKPQARTASSAELRAALNWAAAKLSQA